MVVSELVRLSGDSIRNFGTTITNVHAVQTGETVNVFTACGIGNTNAFTSFNDGRVAELTAREILQIGERVQDGITILGRDQILFLLIHCYLLNSHKLPKQTYFSSMYSAMPCLEPSRPRPDCFQPPNGIGAPVNLGVLNATIPYSNRSDIRSERRRSLVYT
ncbi:hypothetical protein D9M71_702420 [compost metagenome]